MIATYYDRVIAKKQVQWTFVTITRMLPLLLCFKLEKFCSSERKIAEFDQNTSAYERERIRIDWIVQSHGIPALNDDEIELTVDPDSICKTLTKTVSEISITSVKST